MTLSNANLIHTNKNYAVTTQDYEGQLQYAVVNVNTAIVEERTTILPDAISMAEQWNSYLENELWRWIATQGAEQSKALDEIDIPSFDFDEETPLN